MRSRQQRRPMFMDHVRRRLIGGGQPQTIEFPAIGCNNLNADRQTRGAKARRCCERRAAGHGHEQLHLYPFMIGRHCMVRDACRPFILDRKREKLSGGQNEKIILPEELQHRQVPTSAQASTQLRYRALRASCPSRVRRLHPPSTVIAVGYPWSTGGRKGPSATLVTGWWPRHRGSKSNCGWSSATSQPNDSKVFSDARQTESTSGSQGVLPPKSPPNATRLPLTLALRFSCKFRSSPRDSGARASKRPARRAEWPDPEHCEPEDPELPSTEASHRMHPWAPARCWS